MPCILPRECCKSQILLCSLQKRLQEWQLSYVREEFLDLNKVGFVYNHQLSVRLMFTIGLSYLAQTLPFKFFGSVTCILSSPWWKNILLSSCSVQMSWTCVQRSIGLSDNFIWVTSLETRTRQHMQVICVGVLTSAILPEFTGNTQIMLISG